MREDAPFEPALQAARRLHSAPRRVALAQRLEGKEEATVQGWISHPDQVDAKVAEWREAHPDTFLAESMTQYAGRPVWALTVTDRRRPDGAKKKTIFHKPHAHEPAPIAAQVNVINMLLAGESIDGRPTEFDNERVLRDSLLTFLVDANPDGTARAPVEAWDGSEYTNEEFWAWMRGVDPDTGKMWKRVDLWDDTKEEKLPTRYGVVYEQISEHEYVEPNRHHRSSLFRWIFKLWERHDWDRMFSLHQCEFVNRDENAMIILPCLYDEQPQPLQEAEIAWARKVVAAWGEIDGGRPIQEIKPLGYTGIQRQYFVERWGQFYNKCATITSEIQNNNPRTPPFLQMRLNEVAIRVTIEDALGD